MKTVITKAIVTMALLTSGAMAQAAEIPAWVCSLNFNGTSKSVQLLVGHSEFNGTGTVKCVSVTNERAELPIKVTMSTKPLAPKIGLGKMKIYAEALQIAITDGTPEALLGKYIVAEGRAAVGVGAGAMVAAHVNNKGLSLNLAVQFVKGFGFDLGFRKMKIELDETRL